jgi:hypothetical protein
MDILFLLADSQLSISIEWLTGIITAIVTAVGAGAKLLWNYFTNKLEKQEEVSKKTIDAKDLQIAALQDSLTKKGEEHAAAVERLQNVTLDKLEKYSEKVVGLVERVVEQEAEVAAILNSLHVDRGSDTGTV